MAQTELYDGANLNEIVLFQASSNPQNDIIVVNQKIIDSFLDLSNIPNTIPKMPSKPSPPPPPALIKALQERVSAELEYSSRMAKLAKRPPMSPLDRNDDVNGLAGVLLIIRRVYLMPIVPCYKYIWVELE